MGGHKYANLSRLRHNERFLFPKGKQAGKQQSLPHRGLDSLNCRAAAKIRFLHIVPWSLVGWKRNWWSLKKRKILEWICVRWFNHYWCGENNQIFRFVSDRISHDWILCMALLLSRRGQSRRQFNNTLFIISRDTKAGWDATIANSN